MRTRRADPALAEVRLLGGQYEGTQWRAFTEDGRFLVELSSVPGVAVTDLTTGARYRAATGRDYVSVYLADPGELWVKGSGSFWYPSRLLRVPLPAPQAEAASLSSR